MLRESAPRIALAAALVLGGPRVASAEPPGGRSAAIAEGQEHVRRGLELYDEGDLNGAHAELERAYEIAPAFKILYNLAQISLRRQDWVTADREMRAYQAQAAGNLAPARAREVAGTLAHLATRVGTVDIAASAPGARLSLDQTSEISLPLTRPLVVNVGEHVATITWASGERESRSFEIAGGDRLSLEFEPPPVRPERPREVERPSRPRREVAAGVDLRPRLESDDGPALVGHADEPSGRARSTAWSGSWIGWTATAASATGAGVLGILSVRSSRQLAADRGSYPVDPKTLADESLRTHHFALGADVLVLAAAALAGLSIYLSFRGGGDRWQ